MIFPQLVKVTISNNNRFYKTKGYGDHKQGEVIYVNVFDLPAKSNRKIKAKCDDCGIEWDVCFSNVANKNHHRCFKCVRKWVGINCDQSKASAKNRERIGEKHPRWRKDKSKFKQYHRLVTRETNKHNLQELKDYGKRGLAGKLGAFHLDHMVSCYYGYENNISPEIIGAKENLQMISWESNYSKREACSITLGELFVRIEMASQPNINIR